MKIIVTAEVTYEIDNVASFEEAVEKYRTATEATDISWETNFIGTKNLWATQIPESGIFDGTPVTEWELEEVI